jgi:hypothetical protein
MSVLRHTLGFALSISAKGLSAASTLLDLAAQTLRPPASTHDSAFDEPDTAPARPPTRLGTRPSSPPLGTEAVIDELADDVPERGRVVEPPPTPLLDERPHVRTSESHIEDLAAKPANQVVAAVRDLSTDELRLLTEYELAHRNRKTVMSAIERALAPA